MKRVEFNSHGCVSRVGRASTLPPTHYGARIPPGDTLGCVYAAPSRAVSWTLDGKSMGPPVALLEGRSTQISFFVRLDSVAGTAVRLVPSAARRVPLHTDLLLRTSR